MNNKQKLLILLLITFFDPARAHAQTSAASSDDKVTLNIILHPIQTLMVNAGQKQVDLEYRTIEDYQNGVINEQIDHLTICSTGGFDVNVTTSDEHFSGSTTSIEVKDVKITASKGSINNLDDVVYGAGVLLSTLPTGILRSQTGGIDQTFNVKYESAGEDAFINHHDDADDNPAIFTTTVTYSIVAQ